MNDPMGSLEGKVALVTGAARGMGRAFCRRLAEEGADVIAFDICAVPPVGAGGGSFPLTYPAATPADLEITVAEIKKEGRKVIPRIGDVRNQDDLDAAVAAGLDAFGRVDVVVACAGVTHWGRFWEITEDEWQVMIDIDLSGVWRTFKAAVPSMIERAEGGSLIAISSVAGLKALPGQAHYVAAKHGIVGLVNDAAVELGPHRIRVNSIHPWGVDTAMAQNNLLEQKLAANPHFSVSYASVLTEPRLAKPDDIADAVVYLAGDASRCVTGLQLRVDMGATLI